MAEVDENFVNALNICGVNNEALMNAITVLQGLEDVETFTALTNKELDQLAVAINKMRLPNDAPPVVLNQVVLKKLKALRLWLLWQERRDMEMDLEQFDAIELQWGLDRLAFEARCKDAESPEQQTPEKLKSIGFDVWQTFWRQLETYCSTIRGAMAIPISYVLREHDEPTDEMRLADYNDSDEELMATVKLSGADYQHDNKMVWMILVRLVGGGTAWPFIKQLANTFDAREAIKILKMQSQGSASDSSRRARAHGILDKSLYTGRSSKQDWEWFVGRLQYAFTELSETKAGLTDIQKVERLMKNIQSPILRASYPVVKNDPNLEENFGRATAFFASILVGESTDAGVGGRNVSSATTGRSYTDEEWRALPAEDKKAIAKKRKSEKAKKRKTAAVTSGSESTDAATIKKLKSQKSKLARKLKAIKSKSTRDDNSSTSSDDDTVVGGSQQKPKAKA